jgi:hypothetical protein
MDKLHKIGKFAGLVAILIITSMNAVLAAEYSETHTLPLGNLTGGQEKWHVTAFQDKNGKTPALLCFWKNPNNKKETCFSAEDDHAPGEKHYSYTEVKNLKIIELQKSKKPKRGVLFVAENASFDVGALTMVSIWSYKEEVKRFEKILGTMRISEQGEYKIIPVVKDSVEGLFIKADFIWGKEEGRYFPHNYRIYIYQIDKDGLYRHVSDYETCSKYRSLDDADSIDVIRHEMRNIVQRLKGK